MKDLTSLLTKVLQDKKSPEDALQEVIQACQASVAQAIGKLSDKEKIIAHLLFEHLRDKKKAVGARVGDVVKAAMTLKPGVIWQDEVEGVLAHLVLKNVLTRSNVNGSSSDLYQWHSRAQHTAWEQLRLSDDVREKVTLARARFDIDQIEK